MKKLGAALLIYLGLASAALAQQIVGPQNLILCNKVATFTGAAGLAQLIAGVSGERVYICGWHVTSTSATTTTFTLVSGATTTTPCDTAATTLLPALNVTITAPSADHIDYASQQSVISQNVCVNAPATITGLIYYSQF